MFAEVTNSSELMGRRAVLAWVSYPSYGYNPYCFMYPQWVQKGTSLCSVHPSAAPDRGVLYVSIQGDDDASSIQSKYGEVVVATINADDLTNMKYETGESDDQLFAMLNERWTNSQIEFSRLDSHSLGRELFQIVELDDPNVDLLVPFSGAVGFKEGDPISPMVMVEKTEGMSLVYYGPFHVQPTASSEYELSAAAEYRNMIHRIPSNEIGDIVSVSRKHDEYGTAAKFVYRPNINIFLSRPTGRTAIDWMTDEELVDAIASTLKNTRSLSIKKEDIRSIRKAVEACTMETAKIYVTDQRKRRMIELLSEPTRWEEKIDVLASALARPEASEKLIELALSPEYFPQLKSLFVNSEDIQQQIESEKKKYYAEAERAKKATAEAVAAKKEAERQLEEGRAKVQAMKDEALADVQGELEATKSELEDKKAELEKAEASLAALERRAGELVDQLDSSVDEVVEKITRNRVVRKLTGDFVGGVNPEAVRTAYKATQPILRSDEGSLKDSAIVALLHEQISTRAGRDMSEAQVINLLTCLMGSSITVLSGLPGTGKTSLANIVAGSLGLTRPEAPRFTKVSVERGWASHRDFIGYYNPLSKTLEASNTEVLDAMLRLDAEAREAGTASGAMEESIPPYLFLLDEANLSVIENYWSPFLGNADEFLLSPVTLSMQGGESLKIPSNVRWIATVNYDHTTEALSDRFLNRAWVINIDGDSLSIDDLLDSSDYCDFSNVPAFSYGKLLDVFGPKEEALIEDQAAKRLLVSFFERCKRGGRPVSYRCQRAIARYVATAEPLLKEFGSAAGAQAVDFALSQRVLPSINGVGDGIRSLLSELEGVSPALKRTNERIGRMITAGEADGFYQFFA